MIAPADTEIESEFARLTPDAQLDLLERLVHRVRLAVSGSVVVSEAELSAMAADPQVQKEIHQINADFTGTDADGLEGH